MPAGPALTFDPRYVIGAIDTWRGLNLEPISVSDLERALMHLMRDRFVAWNILGMRDERVATKSVTQSIGVLTALKVAKKTAKGKGDARVVWLSPTPDGHDILAQQPIDGTLYPRFAVRLASASPDIRSGLSILAKNGPYTQPVLHVTPTAPKRGAAYRAAIIEGLRDYKREFAAPIVSPRIAYEPESAKATPAQIVKSAQQWAAQAHPAGAIRQLDRVVNVGLAFGLLWADVVQVNEVIAAKSIGLAADETSSGFTPHILRWPTDREAFTQALVNAIVTRANGSGFATIQEVRGAIGRKLSLSPIAVDALLRGAREAGDRHEIPMELHFEADEDQLYAAQRDPLVWREEAFEFITIMRSAHS